MQHVLFGQDYEYGRWGLALIGVGMGLHLISGALNQAALARDRARAAAGCWLLAAVVFVGWMFSPAISDQVLRVEVGYAGAAAPAGGRARAALPARRARRARRRSPRRPRPGRARRRSPSRRRTRPRPRRRHAGRGLGVDPAVDLDARRCAPTIARTRGQLVERVRDERLAAPAGVDGHAERELDLARRPRRAHRPGVAGVDRDARAGAALVDHPDRARRGAASPRRGP